VIQQRDAATALQAQAISTDIALIKALGGGYRFAGTDAGSDAKQPVSQTHSQ
jgi:multidrug efflux system outer membrane protein